MELISDAVDKITTLKNRELERKLSLQKKLDTKKSFMAESEQMEFFQRTFNEKQDYIESLLKKSQTLPKVELPEHFNGISKEILLLQKYVAASNLFLRNYFLKKCQNVLQELSLRAQDLENDLLPKKKFGFKNKVIVKDAGKGSDMIDFALKASANGHVKSLEKDSPGFECGFYKISNEILCLSEKDIAKKDVCLEYLTNCTVYLKGYPSTLHLNHLSRCQIFSGPVSTSIFAENCFNSTLVIACQQLRLHASSNVDIYLHVTSRAIMEDCSNIAIAPYNWSYNNLEKDFADAGLDRGINNWRCVDDFNWLNAERHSPHWKEMDQEKRVKGWT